MKPSNITAINEKYMRLAAFLIAVMLLSGCGNRTQQISGTSVTGSESMSQTEGRIEDVTYTITYEGREYSKTAYVYVPATYRDSEAMDIFYMLHGSTDSPEHQSDALKPLFDQWIGDGSMKPMLVVFPTYYPDRSFVVSNYSQDYPLNHYFATEELPELMKTVEGKYHTWADGTDEDGLSAGREHRAFGGYSMGGVTTWDVLAYEPQYFAWYMPMAGDCWLDRVTDAADDSEIADLLMQGIRTNGYSSEDFHIIAMVGGSDGTKYSMQPQIEALRKQYPDLITDDNLVWWENEGGGHNQESLEAEVEHGVPLLFSGESAAYTEDTKISDVADDPAGKNRGDRQLSEIF